MIKQKADVGKSGMENVELSHEFFWRIVYLNGECLLCRFLAYLQIAFSDNLLEDIQQQKKAKTSKGASDGWCQVHVNMFRVRSADEIWVRGHDGGHRVRGGAGDQPCPRQLWQVQHLDLQRHGQHHLEHQLHPADDAEGAQEEVTSLSTSSFSSSSYCHSSFLLPEL